MNPVMFKQFKRGEKSVSVDLKTPDDHARLLKPIAGSSDLIEGFRPGVVDRPGLGFETLKADDPALVMCSLSGFGQSGPYRDRPAHDINILGMAGYFAVPSQMEGALTRPNIRLADFSPGQSGAMAIAMALVAVGQTGHGSHIDCSMFD